MRIVYSTAKITQPRFRQISPAMHNLKRAYEHLCEPRRLVYRGGSWQLPHEIAQHYIVEPFLAICQRYSIPAMFCKENLLSTP